MLITFIMETEKTERDFDTESKMVLFNQAYAHAKQLCIKHDCKVKFLMEDGHAFTIEQPEKPGE